MITFNQDFYESSGGGVPNANISMSFEYVLHSLGDERGKETSYGRHFVMEYLPS